MILALALSAALDPSPRAGPDAWEVIAAIRRGGVLSHPLAIQPEKLRRLRCKAPEEEPAEYVCRFRAPDRNGRWRKVATVLTLVEGEWSLIDGLEVAD